MIYGVGTDLVNSNRIEILLNRFGDRFLKKIFSKQEIEDSKNSFNKPLFFSKKFAGKEAVWKALSPPSNHTLHFNEIEILSCKSGRPYVNLIGKTKNIIKKYEISLNGSFNFHLSLSDEKPNALAFIIIFLAQVN